MPLVTSPYAGSWGTVDRTNTVVQHFELPLDLGQETTWVLIQGHAEQTVVYRLRIIYVVEGKTSINIYRKCKRPYQKFPVDGPVESGIGSMENHDSVSHTFDAVRSLTVTGTDDKVPARRYFQEQEVSARWNFMISSCHAAAPPCPDCQRLGVLVLHGADVSFYRLLEGLFLVTYGVLSQLSLTEPPTSVLSRLRSRLAKLDSMKITDTACANLTMLAPSFTLGLTNLTAKDTGRGT
ncbi:uncharacterized protein LOC119577532 [Penaeus monodon]|uniref:uncharacterized protein LOC119577532 n=1 Tax=Penaeus monodon TaxID=6687 RepID=UPI0018A6FF2E|nr:uncharacterized protein LOC119577532 [Penaeus monodon]